MTTQQKLVAVSLRLKKAKQHLGRLTGPNAENAALALDHMQAYHRGWYRSVTAARNFLKYDK